jgi:hypothetical protein
MEKTKIVLKVIRWALVFIATGYIYHRLGALIAIIILYLLISQAIDLILIHRAHRNILQVQTNQAEMLRAYFGHLKTYHKGQLSREQLDELAKGITLLAKEKKIAMKAL